MPPTGLGSPISDLLFSEDGCALYCSNTPLKDLSPLYEIHLSHLNLVGIQVSPADIDSLQKALLNGKIEWDDPAKATTQPTK